MNEKYALFCLLHQHPARHRVVRCPVLHPPALRVVRANGVWADVAVVLACGGVSHCVCQSVSQNTADVQQGKCCFCSSKVNHCNHTEHLHLSVNALLLSRWLSRHRDTVMAGVRE